MAGCRRLEAVDRCWFALVVVQRDDQCDLDVRQSTPCVRSTCRYECISFECASGVPTLLDTLFGFRIPFPISMHSLHVSITSRVQYSSSMVNKIYLCAAPRPESWEDRAQLLLKSFGGNVEKRDDMLRKTLQQLQLIRYVRS